MLSQRFDDGSDVADVHGLLQQQLQHFLECGNRHHFWDYFFDEFGCHLGHMLHQLLRFGAAKELGCLDLHQV